MGFFKAQTKDFSPTDGVIYRAHYRGNDVEFDGDLYFEVIVGGEILFCRGWNSAIQVLSIDSLDRMAASFSEYVFEMATDEGFEDEHCDHSMARQIQDEGLDLILPFVPLPR